MPRPPPPARLNSSPPRHVTRCARAASSRLAVSGGSTPWLMLRELARLDLPWQAVQLFQVDERIAPAGDTERNLTHIGDTLLKRAPLPAAQVHAMLVNDADLEAAAARYAQMLQRIAGTPAVLDLVHLGLGS